MDLPVKQVSKGEVKPAEAAGAAPSSSTAEEQKAQIDGDSGSAQSLLCKVFFPTIAKVFPWNVWPGGWSRRRSAQDEKPESIQANQGSEPLKAEAKSSRSEEEDEDDGPLRRDAEEGSSTSRLGPENVKQEHDEEQESKDNSGWVFRQHFPNVPNSALMGRTRRRIPAGRRNSTYLQA